jgi:hypothetical protein
MARSRGFTWVSRRNIWDASATPSGISVSGVYVFMYIHTTHIHIRSLAPTNSHGARVVGYGPFSLCVIHKEGLCPSSGDISRLMMMTIKIDRLPFKFRFMLKHPTAWSELKVSFMFMTRWVSIVLLVEVKILCGTILDTKLSKLTKRV